MRTIEELKELQNSLTKLMREKYSTCPVDKSASEEARMKNLSDFKLKHMEVIREFKSLMKGISEEEWQTIRSTNMLADILLYRRECERECECRTSDEECCPSYRDYKINESAWKDFSNSLSDENATLIWNDIAMRWLDWDDLDHAKGGYYLRCDYAGFSQLFLRIREDMFAYGRAKGLRLVDILSRVARAISYSILLPDRNWLTNQCVAAVREQISETWLIKQLMDNAMYWHYEVFHSVEKANENETEDDFIFADCFPSLAGIVCAVNGGRKDFAR